MAKVHISKWWEKQNLHSYCYSDSIYIYKLIGLWVNQGLMKKIEIILYISNRSTLVEGYWFNCVWKVEKGEGEVIQRLGSTGRSQDYKNKKEEMVLRDPRKYSLLWWWWSLLQLSQLLLLELLTTLGLVNPADIGQLPTALLLETIKATGVHSFLLCKEKKKWTYRN